MPYLMLGAFGTFVALLGLTAVALREHRSRSVAAERAHLGPQPVAVAPVRDQASAESSLTPPIPQTESPARVGEQAWFAFYEANVASAAPEPTDVAVPLAPSTVEEPRVPPLAPQVVEQQAPVPVLIEPPRAPPAAPQLPSAAPARPAPPALAPRADPATSDTHSPPPATSAAPAPSVPAPQPQVSHQQSADPPRPDQARGHQAGGPSQAKGHREHGKDEGAKKGNR